MTQQPITQFAQPLRKYDAKHPKQLLATDALVDFVAEDLMPLRLVESSRFVKFLKILDPQYYLPSRKHLSNTLLAKKHRVLKAKIIDHLKGVDTVNLTIDLWSNRQMRSFLGVTAPPTLAKLRVHYVCNLDRELQRGGFTSVHKKNDV